MLVDKKCYKYVDSVFSTISTVKVDFNITEPMKPDYITAKDFKRDTVPMLKMTEIKPKYDLLVVHSQNFETFVPIMYRAVYIFVLDGTTEKRFAPYTLVNDCFEGVLYMNDFHSMSFPTDRLNIFEQTYVRDKPYRFLKKESELLALLPQKKKIIVEIGSCRTQMLHPIDVIDPTCCNDSHSTFFWCRTPSIVHTVDVNPLCDSVLRKAHENGKLMVRKDLKIHTEDGIKFLSQWDPEEDGKISFLFLDAWDVIPKTDYAEKHQEAYKSIQDSLHETCLIAIDDTDIANGGKGSLLIPHLLDEGFILLYMGRHTVFYRGSLDHLWVEKS